LKDGLTLAFTGKIYFRILGLGLGYVALAWPWLTGLCLDLDTSGLNNVPAESSYDFLLVINTNLSK